MSTKFITKAIVDFLQGKRGEHPGQDLLDLYLKYGTNLETQVNVAAGPLGEPVDGKRATWTDGINEWWNIRIPKSAYDDPKFKDYKLKWPLEEHAEGIGTTGWDWKERCSRWLGFDFDALTGHAAGVGIDEDALLDVQKAAEALPFVEVRKSTGGKGIHLYVYVDAIPTVNHTEHAALARCVLGMMSSETGFDFASQIDCCGGVMWIWHRKLTLDNQGLSLLKSAEKSLTLEDLPPNWKDHIEVVKGKRAKVRIGGIKDEDIDPFDLLTSARRMTPLDDTHKEIIDELARSGFSTVWVPDHHLLQTHTCALRDLMDHENKPEFNIRGYYETTSEGTDRASPNCFMFPLPNSAFKVYRFSPGVAESPTWQQDGEGWTTCFYNHDPDLKTAARALGGAELPDNKGFQFDSAEVAIKVAESLGQNINLDEKFAHRETVLRPNKDGRLVARIKSENSETKPDSSWVAGRGGWWEKVFGIKTEPNVDSTGAAEFDERLRTLVTSQCESAGWYVQASNGVWQRRPPSECKNWLQSKGISKPEADVVLGNCIDKPWELVSMPFKQEYPGDRQWNFNTPRFIYNPIKLKDNEESFHPYWDKVLQHCFCDLDAELKELKWAQDANIRNGYQFGLAWIACCFRDPFEPLPFLFFFGNQNSGKSILHEALSLLVTGGVVSADRALTNNNQFNGELANGVLAIVEEKNIAGSSTAYNRIKEWVTSKTLWIRKMRMDAYPQPNTLHFMMMANDQEACPVIKDDTRIMVIEVPDLLPDQEIPKIEFLKLLKAEAPHFMRTVLNIELPQVQGRLRLPVIDTYKRQQSQDMSKTPLEKFISEQCHYAPGEKILFSDFHEKFIRSLDNDERFDWSKTKVTRGLPSDHQSGSAGGQNQKFVSNISWKPPKNSDAVPYVCVNGRLKLREN